MTEIPTGVVPGDEEDLTDASLTEEQQRAMRASAKDMLMSASPEQVQKGALNLLREILELPETATKEEILAAAERAKADTAKPTTP